ncbi:MAG: D-alanine--D-alanine ligase [Planctomycetota bacterium]
MAQINPSRTRVTVLMGGVSSEREVSLRSGAAVTKALEARGWRVRPFDVTDRELAGITRDDTDVAFIVLHGTFGEDGAVQAILGKRGIPYTGSGPEASRLAMEKPLAKERFVQNGIPTPPWRTLRAGDEKQGSFLDGLVGAVGLPVVVKPAAEGSSVGVSIVREGGGVRRAVDEALRHGDQVILERFVKGRELTVGILEDKSLPPIAIVPGREFYDYQAKYSDPGTRYTEEMPYSAGIVTAIRAMGLRAHQSLGCADFSRVDIIVSEDGAPFVLEVNTIPGMTDRSLLPKAARAEGISFEELCDRLARLALRKRGQPS